MKVLHINTLDKGGAGIAARRLHAAMLRAGIDSHFLTLSHTTNDIPNHLIYEEVVVPLSFIQKLKYLRPDLYLKRSADLATWKRNEEVKAAALLSLEYISFHASAYRIHRIKNFDSFDIIHLHWTSDFLDWATFFPTVKNKKIVWSLHDMAPFTGGYHYANGYTGYTYGDTDAPFLKNTPYQDFFRKELQEKQFVLQAASNDITIVGLSEWMHRCAQKSLLFKTNKHSCIPNTLNDTVFYVRDKVGCRKALNLPLHKKIILFISEHIQNHRKGFDLFLDVYKYISKREDVCFVCIGYSTFEVESDHIIRLGVLNTEDEISIALNAADLLVLPSREDNLPNTVLEALFCGTPVVACNIGGLPDLVYHEAMGMLAGSADELPVTVEQQLDRDVQPEKIRSLALDKFSEGKVVSQYNDLYKLS